MSADISIEDLRKAMVRPGAGARARANDRVKAQALLSDPDIRVFEKIDGTKLTLIRRNNEFDLDDYTKNWYVAYKGNVLYPGESRALPAREEEIKASSSGTAQYSLIHSLLRRVHRNTASIPQGTEFFLEFVQRKPTISRDYPHKHGIFLTLFGPTRYKVTGQYLVSNCSPVDDERQLEEYARLLGVNTYPVLFEGSLATFDGLQRGIRSDTIRRRFDAIKDRLQAAYSTTGDDREIQIIDAVYDLFSEFGTTLSPSDEISPAEGSVIKSPASKKLYKALRFDQHDVEHRLAIKQKFMAQDPEEEQAYWSSLDRIADEIAAESVVDRRRNITEAELNEVLENAHRECYFDSALANRLGGLRHPKTLIQRQEDLYLLVKNKIMNRLEIGTKNGISLGIYILAGQPVHAGHWEVIRLATQECDEVLVITSDTGRQELAPGVMIDAWHELLEPQFHRDYPNATLVISPVSPLRFAVDKMRMLKNVVNKFVFYADDKDAQERYTFEKMESFVKDPIAMQKYVPRPVPRSQTVPISGTQMREFLTSGDKSSFEKFLPPGMDQKQKDRYWLILGGSSTSNESAGRPVIQALYESLRH